MEGEGILKHYYFRKFIRLKPHRHFTVLNLFHPPTETINSDQVKQSKKEMKYKLNIIWVRVETEETKSVSFCIEAVRQAGEQGIA
ncbi:hypothetical protein HJC23_000317 [Cyclotella cryptica]|uniref:Uncharacterized protein n=1 Tax=Cyclotella cryptica TaxID=29204 RepID=A0ABD3P748_9STRA